MIEGTAVLEGAEQTAAMLQGMRVRLGNLQPLLADILPPAIWAFYQEQFRTEGAYGGSPWRPLAPGTLKRAARAGGVAWGLLRRTGTLYSSLTREDAPYSHVVVTTESVEIGTEDPVGVYLLSPKSGGPRIITPDILPDHVTDTWASLVQQYIENSEFDEDAP